MGDKETVNKSMKKDRRIPLRKTSKCWRWIRKVKINGKWHQQSISTGKEDYGEALKVYVAQKGLRETTNFEDSEWSLFRDRYLIYSKTNKAKKSYMRDITTLNNYEKIISPIKASDLSIVKIELYKQMRSAQKRYGGATTIKNSTINRDLGTLKSMMRTCSELGLLPESNPRKVKKLKETNKSSQYLEIEQSAAVRAFGQSKGIKGRVRVDMALYTGFRRSEQLMVRWEDVDFDKNQIKLAIHGEHTLKNYKERTIGMHPNLRETLLLWKKKSNSNYVLGKIDPDALSRWWKRLFKKLKLEATLHTTRHTVGTHITRSEGIHKAKEFLGHASVRTTERYSHEKSELVPVTALTY